MALFFRRLVLALGIAMVLLVVAGPWALYGIGLDAVDVLPVPPAHIASAEQQATAWQCARGKGAASIPALNPYSYLLIFAKGARQESGALAASQVAREHLLAQRSDTSMRQWHLTSAALTIWVTRNWTAEQILSQAYSFGCAMRTRQALEPGAAAPSH